MNTQRMNLALTGLQWSLGIVIFAEAILFLLPSNTHGFATTHLPGALRIVLGYGEIAGCLLMLTPDGPSAGPGCWWLSLCWLS
jgi:hypothetical protein